ncbi:MAG: TonB-dependent receptor, partial [Alphaproteobacteria bacterium]|nr:TonB-dependent receptor [Alphaproteobacteria bacterium]
FGTGVGYNRTGFTAENTWESFSPKFGLDYNVNENVMVYASASRGFKSGGFNGRLTNRAQSFNPETMWSYEMGFKSTLADQRLRLNMAAFYEDYKNFQLSRFTANPVTGAFESVFDNAGKATIWGVEMEMTALLTDNLRLNANAGYLNSRYDKLLGNFGIDVSKDRHLVNAPDFTSRISLTYDHELGDAGTVSFNGAVSYRSKTYLTVSSSEILAQDGYALLEASIRFISANQQWNIIVAGQNLTDKKYREHGFDLSAAPGVQLGYYGTPRTYSLIVRYNF